MIRKHDRLILMALATVAVMVALGPSYLTEALAGSGGGRSGVTEECSEAVCRVNMTGMTYAADSLKARPNAVAVWTNNDKVFHTVTSGSYSDERKGALFDSGVSSLIATGERWEHRFETAGTFDYFCQLHPRMVGQVVVAGDPVQEFPQAAFMIAAGVASASAVVALRLKKRRKNGAA